MSTLGRVLLSSAERLDLPDLLSIDSYSAGDWKYFLKGLVGDTKPFILKGFDVIDPENAIGEESCSVRVADSVVFYPSSNAGSFFHGLEDGNEKSLPLVPELRKNAVNYVYLTFSTYNASPDTRAFWDPDKDGGIGGEFTQDVNTQSVLQVQINVSTGSFPANTIPIAKITVGSLTITSIEDARDMMFRLGSGGLNPNPFNTYAWRSYPESQFQRKEPPTAIIQGGVNPFQGADKNIQTLKEWMDAIMSKLRELGGTTYWYDDTSSYSLISNFLDSVGTTFKSKGIWIHDSSIPGHVTWTEDLNIKSTADLRTYIIRNGNKIISDEQVMYIPMIRNQRFNITDESVSWINGQNYINTVGGAVGLFTSLSKGDFVKKANDTGDKWLRVDDFYDAVNIGGSTTSPDLARSIKLSSVYLGATINEKGRYDKGIYLPSDVVVSSRDDAAISNIGGNFHWLAIRSDTIQNVSNIVTTALTINITEHDGNTAKVVSTVPHNLVDKDQVTIANSVNFNGTYKVEVEDANTFYIANSNSLFPNESAVNAFYATVVTTSRSTSSGIQLESSTHGFKTNDTIIITNTVNYNNSYKVNVRDGTTFTIPVSGALVQESVGLATLARMIVRSEGSVIQVIQGQSAGISGSPAENIRQYIGMNSLSETVPMYDISPSYNTLDGMANYNGTNSDNLTSRVSKLTAMMADKAQDKTIKYLPIGISLINNTTAGAAQEITFSPAGSQLVLVTPGSSGQALVNLPSIAPGISLLANQAAYVVIDRNTASTPSIIVSNIVNIPIEENIFVIALRLSTLDIYIWEGSIISTGSIPSPGYLVNIVRQNQALKLVNGGTWSWALSTSTLNWSAGAFIQIPGLANSVNEINAGSVVLAANQVAYVDINRTTPGGTLIVTVADNDTLSLTVDRFILARRENNDVIVGLHSMRLIDGESKLLYAASSNQTLTYLGQPNAADSTPTYSNITNVLSPYPVIQGDNITLAVGQTIGNVNSILTTLDQPSYDEFRELVASAPVGNQLLGPIANGAIIALPNNSRLSGTPAQNYIVGKGTLEIYLNGQILQLGDTNGWSENGTVGSPSNQILIGQQLVVGDVLSFRIDVNGGPGSGSSAAPDDNFYTLPTEITNSNLDYILIYEVSNNVYRKQTRAQFLAGLSNLVNIRNISADWTALNSDDLIAVNTTSTLITLTLPNNAANIGKKYMIKKVNNAPNDLVIVAAGVDLIDGFANFSFNSNGLTNYGSLTIISDGSGNWWML